MQYYPAFINIKNRLCLVIGGGKVAERKTLSLLKAGARVLIISPEITSRLKRLVKEGKIEYYPKAYQNGDLRGAFLCFSATNDRLVNRMIAEEARREGIPLNVIDEPELCDFIVPSVIRRGDLHIAISTSGKNPALAKHIRLKLERQFGDEYAHLLAILGAVRRKLLTERGNYKYNKNLFKYLIKSRLLEFIRRGVEKDIDALLETFLGKGFTLKELGVSLKPYD